MGAMVGAAAGASNVFSQPGRGTAQSGVQQTLPIGQRSNPSIALSTAPITGPAGQSGSAQPIPQFTSSQVTGSGVRIVPPHISPSMIPPGASTSSRTGQAGGVGRDRFGAPYDGMVDGLSAHTILAQDSNWQTRGSVASSLHIVAGIIGPDEIEQTLFPIIQEYTKDVDHIKLQVMILSV